MSDTQTLTATRTPTVYFIDDSATMREVIKIAFRKENIHVITCADAASALEQFGDSIPDAVITDVIMPDKDGYEVCRYIKEHERFGKTPVILMSGIVNQSVAEKATIVKADELIRKPFQPQDLIARVKSLMYPKSAGAVVQPEPPAMASRAPHVLGNLFAPESAPPSPASPRTAREEPAPITYSQPTLNAPAAPTQVGSPTARTTAMPAENQKLRNEVRRLELLVKKLQAELEAGREYCTALEAHFKSLQESE